MIHEMQGMRREDAGNYLNMVAEKENLRFTYPAQQALIRVALSTTTGGIHTFTTIIGRCITLARVMYYKAPGRSFPANARCILYPSCRFYPAVPEGKAYPGAELILTPPATPEPVLIDEGMVNNMLNEYKSHFLFFFRKSGSDFFCAASRIIHASAPSCFILRRKSYRPPGPQFRVFSCLRGLRSSVRFTVEK